MSGGPLQPRSIVPDASGYIWGAVFVGSNQRESALVIDASLGGDAKACLHFDLPPVLPSGTCKLHLKMLAAATSGAAKFNPKPRSVAAEESADQADNTGEGTTTVTWEAGDTNAYKEAKITIDADTPVAGETLQIVLLCESTGWTLAADLYLVSAALIWE